MFGSVVVVAFQSVFHSKKYANNIILFFKNHFWDQHIKMIWKHKKHINSKKKKIKFFRQKHPQTPTIVKSICECKQTKELMCPQLNPVFHENNITRLEAVKKVCYFDRIQTL